MLDSELLSCIVLGGTSTQAPAMQDHLSSQQKSSQSRSTPHSAHARHSPHSAHTSHHQQQQQQQHRTLSSWQLRSASPTDSVSSASGSGSVISYPSVIGGKRTDQLRRSPSGAINSMPLTGALKRGAALGSTTVKSIGTPVVSGTRRSMTAGGINTAG